MEPQPQYNFIRETMEPRPSKAVLDAFATATSGLYIDSPQQPKIDNTTIKLMLFGVGLIGLLIYNKY